MFILINSYDELKTLLESYNLKNKRYIFRGCVNKSFLLSPSAYRNIDVSNEESINKAEEKHNLLINTIKKEANNNPNRYFKKYYEGQHNGLKTKLLDFSFDYRVAMIFACQEWDIDNKDKNIMNDGVIYILDSRKFKKVKRCNYRTLGELIVDSGEDVVGLIGEEKYDVAFQKEIQFITPRKSFPRIKKQDGCFLLFPKLTCDEYATYDLNKCEEIVIIPHFLKKEISKKIKEEHKLDMDYLR